MPAAESSGQFTAGQLAAARMIAFIPGTPNLFGNVPAATILAGIAGAIPEEVSTTTYNAVAADVGKIKDLSNAAGCAVTIPDGIWQDYDTLVLTGRFTGCTLVAGGATTFRIPGGGVAPFSFQEVNALVQLKNMGGDDWLVVGGIEGTI